MTLLKRFLKHETATPLLALVFASGVSVALVAGQVAITHRIRYGLLIWNLFLAWLPLGFAVLARWVFLAKHSMNWKFFALAIPWLLFFPNAPYIFTDLIHLRSGYFLHYWIDLLMILLCALTGLVLGFVSLYLMQSVVARKFGQMISWIFVVVVTALASYGIYLGRFVRLNSWDVVLNPSKVYNQLDDWPKNQWLGGHPAVFLVMYAVFLFLAYVMLYALTQLPKHDLDPTASKHA